MGFPYPQNGPIDGDEPTYSPGTAAHGILGASPVTGGTRRIYVADDGGLLVHVGNNPSGIPVFDSTVNVYSEALVPFNTETTILTYTVPADQRLYITQVHGWGYTNGEFVIYVDGDAKSGGFTSAAEPNYDGNFVTAPIVADAGQIVTITLSHMNPAAKTMKANLLGGIKNV
jgi:hypothetical protein